MWELATRLNITYKFPVTLDIITMILTILFYSMWIKTCSIHLAACKVRNSVWCTECLF